MQRPHEKDICQQVGVAQQGSALQRSASAPCGCATHSHARPRQTGMPASVGECAHTSSNSQKSGVSPDLPQHQQRMNTQCSLSALTRAAAER